MPFQMLNFDYFPALITGFTVAALHAALPTHWLPFVLASRSQKWSYFKTISILLIAGLGHIFTTTIIGVLVVWFGLMLHVNFENVLNLIASASIFIYGSYQIYQHFNGIKHSHCHHDHPHTHDYQHAAKDGWAILSLLALLTFSPCEAFIPVYVSAWPLGWKGFLFLSIVLGVATLLSMLLLTTLAFVGFRKLKLHWLETHEKMIIGIMLILLSFFVFYIEKVIPHSHTL